MMKRLYTISLFIFCFIDSYAQPVVNRSSNAVTVVDGRLGAGLNLYVPRYSDTTAANLNLGIDSCGAQIFTYADNSFWLRACSPKRWIKQLKTGDVSSVTASNGLNIVGSDVRLGGTLTQNTSISMGNDSLNLGDSGYVRIRLKSGNTAPLIVENKTSGAFENIYGIGDNVAWRLQGNLSNGFVGLSYYTGGTLRWATGYDGPFAHAYIADLKNGTPSATFESEGSTFGGVTYTKNMFLGDPPTPDTARLNIYTLGTDYASSNMTNRWINASNYGSTFNTSGGAIINRTAIFDNSASRSSGANALTNTTLYVNARNAQNNYAIRVDSGDVIVRGIGSSSANMNVADFATVANLGITQKRIGGWFEIGRTLTDTIGGSQTTSSAIRANYTYAAKGSASIPDNISGVAADFRLSLIANHTGYTGRTVYQGALVPTNNVTTMTSAISAALNLSQAQTGGNSLRATGWFAGVTSHIALNTGDSVGNFAWFNGGAVQTSGGAIDTGYIFYAGVLPTLTGRKYAFYNAGSADSNYFAGPVRQPNLVVQADTTLYKPMAVSSNGTVVRMSQWSGGGAVNPLTATQLGFVNSFTYTPVLPFLYDSSWALTTSNNYVVSGVTAAISGNKVQITGSGNNYIQQYYKNTKTYVERWEKLDTVIINSTISATTFGIGTGIVNGGSGQPAGSNLGYVDLTTGVNAGKLFIVTWGNTSATSSGAITFNTGDTLYLAFRRNNYTLTFTVTDKTTSSTQSVSFTMENAFTYNNDIVHIAGNYAFAVKGGQYTILGTRVNYKDTTDAPIAGFGDSKTQGKYAGDTLRPYINQLNLKYTRTLNLGSSGDLIVNLMQRIGDLSVLKPKLIILSVGTNDFQAGQTFAQLWPNYLTLTGRIQTLGIKVIHIVPWQNNSANLKLAQLDSALKVNFPFEYVPQVWTQTKLCGTSCLVADNVHENGQGHDTVYKYLVNSGLLAQPIYTPAHYQFNIGSPWATQGVPDYYGLIRMEGNDPTVLPGNNGNLRFGTLTANNIQMLGNAKAFIQFNYNISQPQIQFLKRSDGSELMRFRADSLDNLIIGKATGQLITTGSGNTIFGDNAAQSLNNSSNNTIVGYFAGGPGVGGNSFNGGVMIGKMAGYYENRPGRFYISNSNDSVLIHGSFTTGQIIINPTFVASTPTALTASAQLEVVSTTRGFLQPRMTATQRNAISSPATGLSVFDTDSAKVAYYNGSAWKFPVWTTDAINIYNSNGTLAADRTISGNGHAITFSGQSTTTFAGTYFRFAKSDGSSVYENIIGVTGANRWDFGYTTNPGAYPKGTGISIDTNNNANIGGFATTYPLYATGNSTYIAAGLQSGAGNFYKVTNINSNTTIGLTEYFITIDASGGNVTITLPAASSAFAGNLGIAYVFKRTDASGNTVTIQRNGTPGTDTIDGAANFTIVGQYTVKEIICSSSGAYSIK